MLTPELEEKYTRLRRIIGECGSVVVAYSGGVDWNVLEALSELRNRATDHKNIEALTQAIARLAGRVGTCW